MQHLDEGTIHSWLDGALSTDEAARAEAHVAECAHCQAAIAEARGFIAASSRILTALDNAPRGVIPAARPKKRDRAAAWVTRLRPADPMVWRVAATVLVVAAGTFAVVRNSPVTRRTTSSALPEAANQQSPRATAKQPDTFAAAAATPAPATPSSANSIARRAGSPASNRTLNARALPPSVSKKEAPGATRTDVAAEVTGGAVNPVGSRAFEGKASAAPAPAAAAPPNVLATARLRAADLAAMDALAESGLRQVDTRRAAGEKQTFYEVAAGDTVVLAEALTGELSQVVASGANIARPTAPAAGAIRTRAAAKLGGGADTTPTGAAATFAEGANGTNTLTWKDSTSGPVMKLSGRHTHAELEQIKLRIERARAAAAAARKNH